MAILRYLRFMEEAQFSHKELTMHYYKYGRGKRIALAFHGFGQEGSRFGSFATELEGEFTTYSFDLFFHGESDSPETRSQRNPLKADEWINWIDAFCTEKKIERFSLWGYSLGGRLALYLYSQIPDKIEEMVLFAPDGLALNWWYRAMSRSRMGGRLYRSVVRYPRPFLAVVDAAQRVKIIDNRLGKFVHHQMQTRATREQVYHVWLFFRELEPDIHNVVELLNKIHTPVYLFFGHFDSVIPMSQGLEFQRSAQSVRLFVLETGHDLMLEKYLRDAAKRYIKEAERELP